MNKTVTFETAKRLWDIGIRLNTERRFVIDKNTQNQFEDDRPYNFPSPHPNMLYIMRPDAQELYDRLTEMISIGADEEKYECFLTINKVAGKSFVQYVHSDWVATHRVIKETLPEALAEMLIWLIENKYVTVEQINKGE